MGLPDKCSSSAVHVTLTLSPSSNDCPPLGYDRYTDGDFVSKVVNGASPWTVIDESR